MAETTQAHDIDWSDPVVLRYHAQQNRSFSKAKVRKNMCMYLKNQGGYKQSYFRGMSYEDIRPIFERVWDQNHAFVPKDFEIEKEPSGGSRKKTLARKRASEKQSEEGKKRQKMEDDTEKEELKAYLDIVPGEEFAMDVESLSTKADGSSKNYKIFSEMIDDFDRHDVMDLHRLVKERYSTTSPEVYDLMLWGDLKTLFEPDEEDKVWRNQHGYNLISWKLIDSCGIHILLMDNGIAIHMMIYKIITSEVEECLEESSLTGSTGSDEEILEQHELTDNIPLTPHDSPLPRGHTPGSDEGRLKQDKLMDIVTALSRKVEGLESDLKKTKKLYAKGFGDGQEVSTAAQVSTASTFVSTVGPQRNANTTADGLTLAKTLMKIRKSDAKDKDSEWDDVLARVAADEDFRQKRAGQEVLEKPVKGQKIGEASGSGEEQSAEKEKELSEKELQKLLVIVPMEELAIQPLQVRVGNHTEAYQIFADMLKKFDRDDLVKLWDLVKERFSTTEPTYDKEKELWVKLKRLFKPDNDDILWKLQRYMHDPLVWRLYDTCGVHHVSLVRGHDIFMLVEKEYPLTRGTLGLMMVARLLVEADSEMSRELLRKIFYQANRPRQGGLLGIRGFYNLMLLVQVCAAAED
ncbi:hypothetical protein Tco_0929190 [Tanacetum coccineum]